MSLNFDIFPEVRRDIEVFTLDNGWLAFLKAAAGDGFKLQDFLLSWRPRLFSGRFLLRRARCGLGLAVTSRYQGRFGGDGC